METSFPKAKLFEPFHRLTPIGSHPIGSGEGDDSEENGEECEYSRVSDRSDCGYVQLVRCFVNQFGHVLLENDMDGTTNQNIDWACMDETGYNCASYSVSPFASSLQRINRIRVQLGLLSGVSNEH